PPDGVANLKDVKTVRGDYDEAGLKNACDRPELIDRIVSEWHRLTPGKRTIAFCVDLEHARHVTDAFRTAGIPTDTVEGGTPIKERQRMYRELREEKILVLTSCNVISIGFDEPSVEVGLMLRPTQSSALHLQQIGRVMRISPQTGKQYGIILDQAGNLERLGFPEDIKEYHLPLQKDGSSEGAGAPPMKPCPQCGRIVYAFIVKCPDCGHQWTSERPINTADMVEIYSRDQAHQINDIPTLIELFHSHRRRAYLRGNAPTWADRSFWEHCGRWPQSDWYRGSLLGNRPSLHQQLEFLEYLTKSAKRIGKRADWITQEFEKECGPGSFQRIASQPRT
ncbi:helicase SNF2, partial [filamentous cyanobacterium CCP5]